MANLIAEKREGTGKYVAFDLRKQGKLPGVLYGYNIEKNVPVSVPLKEFVGLLDGGDRLLDLQMEGKHVTVLIKQVQYGTFEHQIMHADFFAIDATKPVNVEVEIELTGDALGVAEGGILDQIMFHVGVECLPKNIINKIVLDVSNLKLNDVMHVSDLPKLEGVTYDAEGDEVVISCHAPAAEKEEGEGGEEGEGNEPEVIGEKDRAEKEKD